MTPADCHDSPDLRRLVTRAQISDVLEDEIERAMDECSIPELHVSAHPYFYTLLGGGAASSRLDRWYVSSCHANWVRDMHRSVPGPHSDYNGVTIRLDVPHSTVRVRPPRRLYPVPESAKANVKPVILAALDMTRHQIEEAHLEDLEEVSIARRLADWWDSWKTRIRISLLSATKAARQRMTRSYKQSLR